jgi:hypothetical protein
MAIASILRACHRAMAIGLREGSAIGVMGPLAPRRDTTEA